MKKRLLAGAMAVASIAALLAGCGGSGSSQAAGDATANTASDEGQVINIYSWNDEFRTRLEADYPEVDQIPAPFRFQPHRQMRAFLCCLQRWRCESIPNRTQTGQNRQTKLTKPVLPFTV